VKSHYCTASCSGGDTIRWHAHEIEYCSKNADSCPKQPPIVPVAQYRLKGWSKVVRPPMACVRPAVVPKVTVVILAYKETESLSASLKTYEEAGFLQVGSESVWAWDFVLAAQRRLLFLMVSSAHCRWAWHDAFVPRLLHWFTFVVRCVRVAVRDAAGCRRNHPVLECPQRGDGRPCGKVHRPTVQPASHG
jgi:hypothetical protein